MGSANRISRRSGPILSVNRNCTEEIVPFSLRGIKSPALFFSYSMRSSFQVVSLLSLKRAQVINPNICFFNMVKCASLLLV